MFRYLIIPCAFAISLAITSCAQPPFVHKAGEFNRESGEYGKPITDITSVTVCYSSNSTTPQEVSKLARDECAKFEKAAIYSGQDYRTCPLVTPVAAIYSCIGSNNGSEAIKSGKNSGSTTINYDGIPFTY
ncbi:MAG: hypothetical protein HQ504_10190 [Rhodospirillaceae bacterium]|nr:hypothetical protein [Rhodospirillaceae bacterium]